MKVKLFKSLQNTVDKYLLQRLEIQESVLADEVKNLESNMHFMDVPSDRILSQYDAKKSELETIQHNIRVIKERLKK